MRVKVANYKNLNYVIEVIFKRIKYAPYVFG